ncbi:hypothetical protein DBR39_23370 [Chryseobacterium sp. KBW03]|uniref:hypothetical protein n=1 Tax=Chryseobacterium sp. KBW03 TaxID=2153362 RepID=UPI000F5A1102|nr:hypothetical protein [Chryseobacterium sp. KBW03]RQO33138.1 hypothetical protein DBR39_23370 [Chryseobacterium sp. KBW03]
MNILKFYRPNISESFIGNLIDNDVALDLVTNEEVNISNCFKSEIDLFSNQFIINSFEKYFLLKDKFIFKFYILYKESPNIIRSEYFGFKIYDINDNTSEFDYNTLQQILNSNPDLVKNPDEYAMFKSEVFLEYLPFFHLNDLIDRCLSYEIMSEEDLKEIIILNLEKIQ